MKEHWSDWRKLSLLPDHCPDCGDDLEHQYFNHGFMVALGIKGVFCACGDRHIKVDGEWRKG